MLKWKKITELKKILFSSDESNTSNWSFFLYKKPTIYNLQSGHCLPVGTIPMGAICYLDATNKTVRFDYSNCEDNK